MKITQLIFEVDYSETEDGKPTDVVLTTKFIYDIDSVLMRIEKYGNKKPRKRMDGGNV